MSGTTDTQLKKLMKGEKGFHGCFLNDNVPSPLKPGSYLISLDNSHWIALYNFGKKCYMFDPLALLFINEINIDLGKEFDFKKKLESQFGVGLKCNNQRVEDWKSDKCGQYCVEFLKHAAEGMDSAQMWINENSLHSYDKERGVSNRLYDEDINEVELGCS